MCLLGLDQSTLKNSENDKKRGVITNKKPRLFDIYGHGEKVAKKHL